MLWQMQENKIIQPSQSPLASPIVLVKKKDVMLWFCVDHQLLKARRMKRERKMKPQTLHC